MNRLFFPLAVGLAGTLVLLSLGTWQVQRLSWKKALLSDIESRIAAAPVAVPAAPSKDRDMFLPVTASGRFSGEPLRVLVSVKLYGAGHRLISVFETEGRRLMVDRGYVRLGASPGLAAGPVEVSGNLHWPQDADGYTPAPDAATGVWFARDVEAMADLLGTEPVLLILRRMSPPDTEVTPLPVDTAGIPNDHLQYAITWFSLAVVWIGMTVFWLRRNRAQATRAGNP